MLQTVLIVVSLGLTAITVAVVGQAVLAMLGVIRRGQPAPGRAGNPVGRTLTMLKETFGHTRMLQWTWVGIMHWFVFAAFLFLSTAVAAAYFQLFDPEFVWPVVGHFYPYEWFSEIIGLLSTIGVIVLIIYRQKHHPRTEGRDSRFYGSRMWQAYFVEFLALFEGGAILFVRGAEYNLLQATGHTEHATRAHFPIASWFGDFLYPNGAGDVHTLENIIYAIATFKIVLAMVWLLVVARNLTMGIAWHRFTAWFNIWFKREDSGRTALGAVKPLTSGGKAITLDDVDDLDEDATLGAGDIWDFSWKDILDFTTCTECGRCQSQCPAWNTEKPLSPKLMIMALREESFAAAGRGEGEENRALVGKAERSSTDGGGDEVADYFYYPEGGDFVVDEDALWACTNCGACVQQCPVDIEHVDHFIDMRRYQVLVESNFPSELNGLFKGLENKGNPWNMSPTARLDWAKDLPFEVKVVGDSIETLDEVDWLFWVGCAGAYEDRAKKTTRAVAELLDLAGVSFGVLGNGETCTGDSARRAGNEFVFQGLAQQNIEVLTEAKAKKVVSTCPHCMNTLKNEYRDLGIELEVIHHTQLLNRLVREGKLTPVADGAGAHDRKITYHDPCFLGRHNNVYSPPRDLLEILPGAEFAEMDRNKEKSFCCGAGGARMWMEETIGERINLNRTAEAVGTGADQVAVGCPFCRVMLSDGLTKMQADGEAREEVEVLDVAQMLLASVKGEQATKLLPGQGAPLGAAAGAGAGVAEKSVETKAEPEPGDVTVTENTVVDTEDAGPAAKASGGSSMFDDPGSMFDEPAAAPAEAKAAPAEEKPVPADKPAAESGGSLFDDSTSLFDKPADSAPAAKAEPAKETVPKEKPAEPGPAQTDLGGGGSLFDLGGDGAPAVAATPAPAKEEAKAEPKAVPAEDKPAAEKPASDLGGGGSLFDIEAERAAAPAQPAAAEPAAAPAEPEPAAKEEPAPKPTEEQVVEAQVGGGVAAAAPRPAASIPENGSLFDIEAPEPAARTSSSPAPESATPGSDASPVDAPVPGATDEGAPVDDNARQEEAAAVADTPAATPATAVSDTAVPEEPAKEAGATEIEVLEEELAAAEDGADEGAAEEKPAAEPPVAEDKPADKPTPAPKSSGDAHQPKTDVDINESGSLFDL